MPGAGCEAVSQILPIKIRHKGAPKVSLGKIKMNAISITAG